MANEQIDERQTRIVVDQQLRQAGWAADSSTLRYSAGSRPERGRNLAIAEWPTAAGPADYVLFVGLTPIATVEAKKENTDVSGSLEQAKRYARNVVLPTGMTSVQGSWREYKIPFVFSTNGRPYLRQLATRSGIWFCDVRRSTNLGHALEGWYTPEGLQALLSLDEEAAYAQLETEPFSYGFPLRYYQREAIEAVENALRANQREMLIAMATGTGKTKTCIALIYRLLKVKRFRRVLFLVDRAALGEQAANAFKDTRMENLQTFADIFGIKELEDQSADADTAVHIATVQGMVRRVLSPDEHDLRPSVDEYDCIIVDECHRGYLLDRELSDTELSFRGFEDYVSKYRQVLEYFDAVKVGLTATPALHTTQIFGLPIFTYTYREAVLDGYLIDHEPPIQIRTELSTRGISWRIGEEIQVYNPHTSQLALFTTPDEIKIEVEDFNKKVITEEFNRVVCDFLAGEIDPASHAKTLVFCVNDAHADLVVTVLKEAFRDRYGTIDDDAVLKVTGAADRPLQLIRRYKNELNPNVAVTVDLLTTGIDVPEISNLVFLRRINSRILFDQMLGRATRLCEHIGKETFRVFDAVGLYEALRGLTDMEPVVVDPKLSFSQLIQELVRVPRDDQRNLARDQFIAKLQRKKRHLDGQAAADFETLAGMSPDAFIRSLRSMPIESVAAWFVANSALGEILDRRMQSQARPVLVSEHPDALVGIARGYGNAMKPADYLKEFTDFVRANQDTIPAIITVVTRPQELTRRQLRQLVLAFDKAGFTETNLDTAWRELTNREMAARIIGYIRQAASGEPMLPYAQRVDLALERILVSRYWTTPQRQWLQRIAAQTKANLLVDREALNDPDLIFKREGGGFGRLNRVFAGQLVEILDSFNEALWQPVT